MIYLSLSIICSSAIFIIFRSFIRHQINTQVAIVVNYFFAAAVGISLNLEQIRSIPISNEAWFPNAILLGTLFIVLFNVMALTTQKLGASVGSIANKMALIVPVTFAMIFYGDAVNLVKVLGIILALLGIFLSTVKPKTFERNFDKKFLWLPFILLIGSGFIDTFVKYNEQAHLETEAQSQLFSASIFFTAFIWGLLYLIFSKKLTALNPRNIIAGGILGVVNFGAIFFLIQALKLSSLQSSVIFPLNNVGVVLLTSGWSLLLFKEKFSWINVAGIGVSVLAVVLIALSAQ